MLGVFANDHYFAFSFNDLAFFADLFYGWFHFHCVVTIPFSRYFARQVMRPLVRS